MKSKKMFPIVLVSISIILFIVSIVLVSNSNYFKLNNNSSDKDNNSSQIKEEIEKENNTTNNDNNLNNETVIQPEKEDNQKEESNNSDKAPINNNNDKQENSNIKEENNNEIITNKDNDKNDNQVIENNKPNNNDSSSSKVEETVTSENDVITYFLSSENSINSSVNQDDKTFREKAKETFVTIVDFIFYDKEVKGYTFDELTTSAKLKIIKIALSIDSKIDEYFPDYKTTIKDKYTSIKGKLAVKYLEFTSTLCEKVGADTCNQAKEDFNTMKESFGFTWELIKELASSGSTKVKEFYESWRDSE